MTLTASRMLYDFHKSQNARKPNSVHATYLVYGTKRAEEPNQPVQGDGDVEMTSSIPEVESIPEQVPTFTLSLVTEKKLQGDLGCRFDSAMHRLTSRFRRLGPV